MNTDLISNPQTAPDGATVARQWRVQASGPRPPRAGAPLSPEQEAIAARVRTEIERTLQRQIKGLELIASPEPPVGLTPREMIYTRGTLRLWHYRPAAPELYRVPLLFVMSLVTKPYILDLTPGQSLIEHLVGQGFDVYLVDWGTPRPEDAGLRLEDYVLDFLPDCVQRVRDDCGEDSVSLVGYCLGGTLAAMFTALNQGGPVANLACFTTPVDFHGMSLFHQWTDPRYFDVDRIVDSLGNVPPELLFAAFELLKPVNRAARGVQLWDNIWNDDFVKSFRLFERWANDHIPFAGECFRQIVKELLWENRLLHGTLELGGRRVDLAKIDVPLFHVMAAHDHIVPYEAARQLVPMAGSIDKDEVVFKGGHVSLVAGGNAMYRLWPRLEKWLAPRSM